MHEALATRAMRRATAVALAESLPIQRLCRACSTPIPSAIVTQNIADAGTEELWHFCPSYDPGTDECTGTVRVPSYWEPR